jgi:hypothetical protein
MQGSTVIAIGGPYSKSQMNTIVSDTLCLPAGCYEFAIADLEGDGLSTIGCSEGDVYCHRARMVRLAAAKILAGWICSTFA